MTRLFGEFGSLAHIYVTYHQSCHFLMIKNPEIFSELYRENNKGVSYKIWKIQQKSETDLKPFQVFIVTKLFFNPEMKSGTLKISPVCIIMLSGKF